MDKMDEINIKEQSQKYCLYISKHINQINQKLLNALYNNEVDRFLFKETFEKLFGKLFACLTMLNYYEFDLIWIIDGLIRQLNEYKENIKELNKNIEKLEKNVDID